MKAEQNNEGLTFKFPFKNSSVSLESEICR